QHHVHAEAAGHDLDDRTDGRRQRGVRLVPPQLQRNVDPDEPVRDAESRRDLDGREHAADRRYLRHEQRSTDAGQLRDLAADDADAAVTVGTSCSGDGWTITWQNCPLGNCTLNAGATALIDATFAPTMAGHSTAQMLINSNDPDEGMVNIFFDGLAESNINV